MDIEINKILVKLPKLSEFVFLSFPFLTILSEEYPKATIQLIVEEGDLEAFLFLPFKVQAIERPAHKKNLIETHHFVANQKDIFNIDLFFDLENTFNSAFIGFNFRAKRRIGFEMGWNKHLLTDKIKTDFIGNFERQSIYLLEKFLNKNFSELKLSHPVGEQKVDENIDKLFKEPEPPKFILIMLDNFSSVTRDIEMWKKFFESFEKQKFLIWTLKDESVISEIFAKLDNKRNELYIHHGTNPKELNYMLKKMTGVIVNNIWAENLLGYYNQSFISLVLDEKKWPMYQYFKFHTLRVYFSNHVPVSMAHRDENKNFSEFNEFIDFIHFNFKL